MSALPSQFQLLSNAIEFASQNHRAISQNLANVNTPHYHAKELSFQQFLDHAQGHQRGTGQNEKSVPEFKLQDATGLAMRADGNNVDLDRELANLKKNDLAHQTLTQLLGSKIGIMKKAIRG